MSEILAPANADPARYELYSCEQLSNERKSLAAQTEQLEQLMAKAKTAPGGSVIAEAAYGPDYMKVRGQAHFAEKAWQQNRCKDSVAAK
ncbi:hypothetical protein [Bradyrhizobium sp. BR 10289]|uniref:hypothetical protein n=1 Tax=Bradyrhizobium sp. BR 10289 TaxID=2749993 RepID=UPI001C653ED0|nr:hypothetical protein [Bradyrhizobium sp. BR 10289]MBW7970286.1 hypothetical protein [Bradyrhizobium sp. BR 10289]